MVACLLHREDAQETQQFIGGAIVEDEAKLADLKRRRRFISWPNA